MTTIFTNAVLVFILFSILVSSDAMVYKGYCIADAKFPEDVLMNAMNWACTNGADCSAIQPGQSCFFPDTIKDHASYAFNSYYQRTRLNGGTCYFNAAAGVTTFNPSHDSCKFDDPPQDGSRN